MICQNPNCRSYFVKTGRSHKFCTYACGDKLRSKLYRDRHVKELRDRRLEKYPSLKPELMRRHTLWRSKNRAKIRQWAAGYRDRIGKKFWRAYYKKWYEKNKDRCKSYRAKRLRAKTLYPDETISELEWSLLKEAWDYRCAYCLASDVELTQDHVHPLSKGGLHTMENIVPACKPCNSSKCDKSVEDFILMRVEQKV